MDMGDFKPQKNKGYVLWNKARADFVSDPDDMQKVAALLPDIKFHTTIGRKENNVHILNPMSFEKMKRVVSGAGVYLCTARETFGIGTLEAMSAGVGGGASASQAGRH